MKTLRKWQILLLAAVLALSLSVPALAAESAPDPADIAAEFFALLDEENVEYTDVGFDADGDYKILLSYPGDDREEHEIYLFIDADGQAFSAYEWYLMEYDPDRLPEVLELLNSLNDRYRFVTFLADTSDNTVTAETHGELGGDAALAARVLDYAYAYLPLVTDHAWAELAEGVPIPAAGEPEEEPEYTGTWKFASMTFTKESDGLPAGTVLTVEDFGTPEVFVMELSETGEMNVSSFGIRSQGTWIREGDTLTLTDDTGVFSAAMQPDGTLILDAAADGGYTMTLTREE